MPRKTPAPGQTCVNSGGCRSSLAGGWGQRDSAGWIDPSSNEFILGVESHEAAARRLLKGSNVSWEAVQLSPYVEGRYTAELLRRNWIRRRGCDFAAWLRPVGRRPVSKDTVWRMHDHASGCTRIFAEACNESGCRAIGPYVPSEMVTELGGLGRWRRGLSGTNYMGRILHCPVPRFRAVKVRA